jgi:hypothetical protein
MAYTLEEEEEEEEEEGDDDDDSISYHSTSESSHGLSEHSANDSNGPAVVSWHMRISGDRVFIHKFIGLIQLLHHVISVVIDYF